jgi:hypothetical protein
MEQRLTQTTTEAVQVQERRRSWTPKRDGYRARLEGPGEVAQLVEHTAENRGVAGSIPALATEIIPAKGG